MCYAGFKLVFIHNLPPFPLVFRLFDMAPHLQFGRFPNMGGPDPGVAVPGSEPLLVSPFSFVHLVDLELMWMASFQMTP